AMMKADVLSGFEQIGACMNYFYEGKKTNIMPYDIVHREVKPDFKLMNGWKEISSAGNLSGDFSDYVSFLERELEVKISFISTGPGREEVVVREEMEV